MRKTLLVSGLTLLYADLPSSTQTFLSLYVQTAFALRRFSLLYTNFPHALTAMLHRLTLLHEDFPCSTQIFFALHRLSLLYTDCLCSTQICIFSLVYSFFSLSALFVSSRHSFFGPHRFSCSIWTVFVLSRISLLYTDSLCSTLIFLALHMLSLSYSNFPCFIEIIFDLCQFSLFLVDFLCSTQTFLALCRLFLLYAELPCSTQNCLALFQLSLL